MSINPVSIDPNSAIGEFDAAGVERAIRDLLVAVGEDPTRDGLKDTPARVARSYREIFAGLHMQPDVVLTTMFDIG
ncbi:MAG: GTP cyclohydrolase I, partial [Actinomycetota bacterium]|nr:GTP cyclohydrolase I [Actinomycetota bacterium]